MGNLEKESRKRARKQNLQKFILTAVKAVGVLSIALVTPNVLKAMRQLGISPYARQTESIHSSRNRLIKNGLLIYHKNLLHLTPKGETTLRRLELYDFKIKKPKRWDSKWRVLIFDIPEKKKRLRERIREILMMIGFIRLQDSVWVYPYDCEDVLTIFKTDLKIGKDMRYMIVDTIEYDTSLKKHFSL